MDWNAMTEPPTTPAQNRLIHNERVKLTTNFLSRTGFIVMIVGCLPIVLKGPTAEAIWWIVGGWVLGGGMIVAAFLRIKRII
jgi:hypothetical protein